MQGFLQKDGGTLNGAHSVIGWRGEDAKQARDAASDAGQHALTLLQSSMLQLPRGIGTRPQQLIPDGRQNEASTLRAAQAVEERASKSVCFRSEAKDSN